MKKLLAAIVCLALCMSAVATTVAAVTTDETNNSNGEETTTQRGADDTDLATDSGEETTTPSTTSNDTDQETDSGEETTTQSDTDQEGDSGEEVSTTGNDEQVTKEEFTIVIGEKKYETSLPSHFVDMGDSSITGLIGNTNQVNIEHNSDGYSVFTATGGDPFFDFKKTPSVDTDTMKYTYFIYKTDAEGAQGQIYTSRSDGKPMAESPDVTINFSWEATADWSVNIVDTSRITKEDTRYTAYRLDPLANVAGGTEGKSISIKCLAAFKTLAEAEGFDYDVYKQYLADKKAADEAEEESELLANSQWGSITPAEKETSADDKYEGTLTYEVSRDGKNVTISYMLNGERVSYTVPNNANYTSGGFAGTDDLDRTLPTSTTTGIYGENGEYFVGLFYFLWLGEHGDYGVWDNTKIIAKYPTATKRTEYWGPEQAMHFFAEPLYGYYYSRDEWVIRKHMELLSNANIDFLYFDVTNGPVYISNALTVMKVCHELNEDGFDAPQVVFYTHSSEAEAVRAIYENIYKKNMYPDTWFMVDGKPVIIANGSSNIDDFFITRQTQWPNEAAHKTDAWPWMDFQYPQRVYRDTSGKFGGAISVSVAQHSSSVRFSSSAFYGDLSNRGRTCVGASDSVSKKRITADSYKYGYNFQNQWDRVFREKENVKYVLVTGWNEWVAQRQSATAYKNEPIFFVDTASLEYSRDIEMTRGYYFDNYYMQMISNIQKLKGSAPVILQDARNPINVTGSFDQWDDVKITYKDPQGDTMNRDSECFGKTKYTDESGNHDIVSSKVTHDTKNLYFYVSTEKQICFPNGKSSWMQLFLNTDNDASTGWCGYDYIVNYKVDKDNFKSTVAKHNSTGETFIYKSIGTVDFKVEGNEMMIEVPLEMLGITDYDEIYIEFKWADADYTSKDGDDVEYARYRSMEDFYCLGDVAPLGRLNFIYQDYIPTQEVSDDEETTTVPEQPSETEDNSIDNIPGDSETDGTTDENEKGGCKSVVGGMVLICAICGSAIVIEKKKRN